MSNTRPPLDLKSPIAKMFFGKHKGHPVWTIGHGSLEWIRSNMNVSERTLRTLSDAGEMHNNQGSWAVIRKSKVEKFVATLVCIVSTEAQANARLENTADYEDISYHITE
jgi:hypothetical protein